MNQKNHTFEEKMQRLEEESETITKVEALMGELEGKEGRDKGDE